MKLHAKNPYVQIACAVDKYGLLVGIDSLTTNADKADVCLHDAEQLEEFSRRIRTLLGKPWLSDVGRAAESGNVPGLEVVF